MSRYFLSRLIVLSVLCVLAQASAYAQVHVFDRPAAIEPAVAFWKRIYTEVGTTGGLIHDDTDLDVVYDVVTFPEGTASAVRTRRIEERKQFVIATLRKLANETTELTEDEAAIRAHWPAETTPAELGAAADRVRFQLGQADRFKEGLIRSGAWRETIRNTFRNLGLPEELAALPHVESSFNTHAYSKVGAAGMWQFMRTTGMRFLRIDNVVDERLDPYKASVAAANFMQQNFSVVQSWALAVTAYNHGAAGMLRAKEQLGTDDIGEIIQRYQSKTFGFASRNFYACFLAAMEIDSHPEKYFPGIRLNPPDSSQVVPVKNYTSLPALAKSLQIDTAVLKQLNPSLMAPVWTGSKRIPSGFELRVPSTTDPFDALKKLPSTAVASSQIQDQSHRVRQGETLSGIAAKYGTNTQTLAKLNSLRQPYHLTVGKLIKLPGAVVATQSSVSELSQPLRYTVKAGDSLSTIAERYSVSQSELMALNTLRNANQVRVGQQLLIRAAGVAPANASEPDEFPVTSASISRAEAVEPKTKSEADELGPTLLAGVQAAASADPADYAVGADNTIRVEAGESLSHYAQWLKSSSAILRSLNNLTASAPVQLASRLKLDFSHVTVKDFEAQRFAFHQQLQQAFFERYRIVDSYVYEMKKGESIWSITQRANNVPVWLLRQYNPGVELNEVKPGSKVVIPTVKLIEG